MQKSLFDNEMLNIVQKPTLHKTDVSRSTLLFGDCLIESDKIETGSVDLILTDLPYGTVKDIRSSPASKTTGLQTCEWDIIIPIEKIMELSNRILRKNGKMILFAQDPFSTELKNKSTSALPFNYSMVWEKDHFANCLLAKKAPLNYYEDILVFSKNSGIQALFDTENKHPQREYFKIVMDFIGLPKKTIINKIGQKADHTFRIDSTQYGLCTESTYNELIEVFKIDKMEGFKHYSDLKNEDVLFRKQLREENKTQRDEYLKKHNEQYPSTFNLWEGNKYKSNVLKYKKDYNGYHPTQKPVLLLEDLIKTFSNENDLVVDLTMGSGSTGVACKNTNRNFIGIEKDENYYNVAVRRVSEYCG